ncbi:hypothetical protein BV25DRAFT_1913923 [Artomyces pyxidatus]|uniref:Uncharacterized protein n=1 Tax=Artomyces pyxidatus TaxID=48021 RepID=A0ACB8TAY9_9AGAM|nr:hypothetical protein BV25DRAFT_1913923 [Artomyces pyxidatus]
MSMGTSRRCIQSDPTSIEEIDRQSRHDSDSRFWTHTFIPDIDNILTHPDILQGEEDGNDLLDFIRETQMEFLAKKFQARFHLLRLQRTVVMETRLKSRGTQAGSLVVVPWGGLLPWHRRAVRAIRKCIFGVADELPFDAAFAKEVAFWQQELQLADKQLQESRSKIGPAYAKLTLKGIPYNLLRTSITSDMWLDSDSDGDSSIVSVY